MICLSPIAIPWVHSPSVSPGRRIEPRSHLVGGGCLSCATTGAAGRRRGSRIAPVAKPKVFGTGLIALDLVLGLNPLSPVRSWAGGTCGNVLSILAYLGWDAFPIARMNGDAASERVKADLAHWGVHLDFANCGPAAHTPIIIQEIRRGRDGKLRHRFALVLPTMRRVASELQARNHRCGSSGDPGAVQSLRVFPRPVVSSSAFSRRKRPPNGVAS